MKQFKSIPTAIAFWLLLLPWSIYAQVPQSLNYQAVARDQNGYPIANSQVVVEVTLHEDWEGGPVVWQEIHTEQSNEFGLFNLKIGQGTSTLAGTASSFSDIDWTSGDYYIQTRVDFGGQSFGNGLIDMGAAQLQSVPYALVADSATKAPTPVLSMQELSDVNMQGLTPNQTLIWDGDFWTPGEAQGDYVRIDGTTDLTGDWTISSNNIALSNGSLTSSSLISSKLTIGGTRPVMGFSTMGDMGGVQSSHDSVPTQLAVKNYVDNALSDGAWTLDGTYLYNMDKKIGIGTSTPADKFHAEIGKNGFLVTGTFDENSTYPITVPGPDVLMAFYPGKAAFRAGSTKDDSDAWTNDYVGNYSVAMGQDTRAVGNYSVALGYKNRATNSKAFTAGQDNVAGGIASFAVGQGNEATGAYSSVMGYLNTASGNQSTAIGLGTEAQADNSFVSGWFNKSLGNGTASFVSGFTNEVTAPYTAAFGENNRATSVDEVAFGRWNFSFQFGGGSNWQDNESLFTIGNGTGAANRSNAFVVMKGGNVGIGTGMDAPTSLLQVGTSGDGSVAVANSWDAFSDRRLKTGIKPLGHALEHVLQLNGYYYHWKANPQGERQVGVVAQEVEKVLPELVNENAEGIKTVSYSKLAPVLIEAVKTQQRQIDSLQAANEDLQDDMTAMNGQLAQMQGAIDALGQKQAAPAAVYYYIGTANGEGPDAQARKILSRLTETLQANPAKKLEVKINSEMWNSHQWLLDFLAAQGVDFSRCQLRFVNEGLPAPGIAVRLVN